MIMSGCICKDGKSSITCAPSLKCYKFIFHLDDAVSFGGDFMCMAYDEADAKRILESEMPDAVACVKAIRIVHPSSRRLH
jgi:hypothetical protein